MEKQFSIGDLVWVVEDSGTVICTEIIDFNRENSDLIIVLSCNKDGHTVLKDRVFAIGDRDGVKSCLNKLSQICIEKLRKIHYEIELIDCEPVGEVAENRTPD